MTNALPAALASRQRRSIIDDATSGLGMTRGPHISIRGNRFRLIDAAGAEFLVPTAHMDVVVVDANAKTSKIFFEGEYDPNNDVPPTCFSDNGTGPSTQSLQPQAPTCAVCPWNAIGSDTSKVTGRGIKACSDRKKVAVIIPGDPAVNVYEMQIPPGSLSNFRAYAQWIAKQASGDANRRLDIADFVTRIEFDPEKMGVMKFAASAWADDDHTLKLIEYIDANKLSDMAVGRNDVAQNPDIVKQLAAGGTPAPQLQAPAPAVAPAFALPPRQAAPAQLPPPAVEAPAQQPAATPKPRGRRASPPAAAPATAPFIAPAAPAQPPMAAAPSLDVPDFLRRTPAAPPPAAAPAPRFGVAEAPPPSAAVQDALNDAMNLPTRR